MSLAPLPPSTSSSHPPAPSPAMAALPSLNGSPTAAHPEIGDGPTRKFPTYLVLAGGGLAVVVTALLLYYFTGKSRADRPDLLLHTVKLENLDLTVVERGTLESADNRDIICHLKAGSKGNYASTIKWVIDDGTLVKKGQLIMVLDSSSLEDQYRTQKITVDKAQAEWVKAEQDYKIQVSQNESDIETARTNIALAEIDLEKYVGVPKGTLGRRKREEARALLLEMEASLQAFLDKHRAEFPSTEG